MTSLTKDFYRQQFNFAKRELEKTFDFLALNATQKQKIREIVDRMIEEQRKEYSAPEIEKEGAIK